MKRGTPEHPKMKALARVLGVNRAQAVGIMECLWHWAAKFAPQGNVGKYPDVDIAEGCYWEQNPTKLIDSMVECNWLEKDDCHRLILHDWHDHCDESVKKWLIRNKLQFVTRVVNKSSRRRLDGICVELTLGGRAGQGRAMVQEGGMGEGLSEQAVFPTLAEVKTYASMRNIQALDAEQFWHHFESSGWIDKNGHGIKSWQSKLITWNTNNKAREFEHKERNNGSRKQGGTYQRGSTENPRNVGTCPSTTNYAEVVRRKQAAQVAGQMALPQVGAPPPVDGIGK